MGKSPYLLTYTSIHRENEWIDLTHEFSAKSDQDAITKARRYIKTRNLREKAPHINKFELKDLDRIVAAGKTVPVPAL